MKNIFLLALLSCPLLVAGELSLDQVKNLPNISQEPTTKELVLTKSSTKTYKHAVYKFWSLLKSGTSHTLTKDLTKDFEYINGEQVRQNRSQFVQSAKTNKVVHFRLSNFTFRQHGHMLIAIYNATFEETASPSILFSGLQMNVFQKIHGKWKVQSIADLSIAPQG